MTEQVGETAASNFRRFVVNHFSGSDADKHVLNVDLTTWLLIEGGVNRVKNLPLHILPDLYEWVIVQMLTNKNFSLKGRND